MEIKGTAVIAIRDYVKLNHKELYDKWIEKALEISGAKNCTFRFPKSIAKGDEVTQFDITWEQ